MQYEVEWIASVPQDENGDADIDNALYQYRRFPTKELATIFAQKVIVGLPWEVAYIRPVQEIVPSQAAAWEYDWWREGRKLFAYAGDATEVSSFAPKSTRAI